MRPQATLDPVEWMAQRKMLVCRGLNARIRPEVCEEMRRRPPVTRDDLAKESMTTLSSISGARRPLACESCERVPKPTPPVRSVAPPRPAIKVVAECWGCKRVLKIYGRGLCGRCYVYDRRGEAIPELARNLRSGRHRTDLGPAIRERRVALGWSQRRLAKRLRCSQSLINGWEHGAAVMEWDVPKVERWLNTTRRAG